MSVNKVILVGNVGKDPDIRYLDNGVCVANFTLATSEKGYTTSAGVQIPERTEWHNIVLWRGLAEVAEKYVKRGSQVYIEGKIRTRSWDDPNGQKRYTTEIYADNMMLLGKKGDQPQEGQPVSQSAPTSGTNPTQNTKEQNNDFLGNNHSDDLPF